MPGRALLLDRDGVINVDHGFVGTIDRFEFRPGIFDLIRAAEDFGYRSVVITNQSGIGRGLYSEGEFQRLSAWMIATAGRHGAVIADVFHCPYHPLAEQEPFRRDSFWRKPNPGMILEARDRLGLDLARSIFVGDRPSDMRAARAAEVGTRILISETQDVVDDATDRVVPDPASVIPLMRLYR